MNDWQQLRRPVQALIGVKIHRGCWHTTQIGEPVTALEAVMDPAKPAFGLMIVLFMDHAKAPGKGTTAREPITVFSMNRRSLTPEREDTASRVNASKPTKKQPELITWEEIIGKR